MKKLILLSMAILGIAIYGCSGDSDTIVAHETASLHLPVMTFPDAVRNHPLSGRYTIILDGEDVTNRWTECSHGDTQFGCWAIYSDGNGKFYKETQSLHEFTFHWPTMSYSETDVDGQHWYGQTEWVTGC